MSENARIENAMDAAREEARASKDPAREALAEYAHAAWSGWMRYLFGISRRRPIGTVTIPTWAVERWLRQMDTPYASLSDTEKQSDLAEADEILAVLAATRQET